MSSMKRSLAKWTDDLFKWYDLVKCRPLVSVEVFEVGQHLAVDILKSTISINLFCTGIRTMTRSLIRLFPTA